MLWLTGWKSRDSVPALVKEYLAGQLKVDEFVTHTLPVTKINDAFDLMHHGQRSVLTASIVLLISASYELSEWVEFWHPTRHMIGHFRGESHGHQAVICTGIANQTNNSQGKGNTKLNLKQLSPNQLVLPYIPAYKSKNFGSFSPSKSQRWLICRSENLPSAIAAVVSPVSRIDSSRLVGRVWVSTCLWNLIHFQPSWPSDRSDAEGR